MINKEITRAYIDGEDLDNIDELEDNPEFMYAVLKISKDKKMYSFCSLNVLRDYNFVLNVIELFNKDIDFICLVLDNYLSYMEDFNYNNIYLLLKILSYLSKEDNRYNNYNLILKEEFNKLFLLNDQFNYFLELFNNKIILDYVAEYLYYYLLNKENINIDKYILRNYNSYEEYLKVEKECYYNLISKYDISLADYIINNNSVFDKIKNKTYNQDNFILAKEKDEKLILQLLASDFFHYYLVNSDDFGPRIRGYELYYYLAKKNNLLDIIYKYDTPEDEDYNINEEELSLQALRTLRKLENIMVNSLKK